jgi:uncharacterized C2H2 Zn-finger protein
MKCLRCGLVFRQVGTTTIRTVIPNDQSTHLYPQELSGVNCVYRRKQCPRCSSRFNTVEIPLRDLYRMIAKGNIYLNDAVPAAKQRLR